MKKQAFIAFLILVLGLTSCMTTQRAQRKCEKYARLCGTSERVVTQIKDTTIYINKNIEVKLPADTVRIEQTLPGNILPMEPVTHNNGIITATAWIRDNRLNVYAYLNTPYITINHRDTVYIQKYRATTERTIKIPERYVPKAFKWAAWIVGIELLALVLFIFIKLRPGVFGLVSSFITKKL